MIAILTAALGVVGGLLMGGCTSGDQISNTLVTRNAELEKQLTSSQLTMTGLCITVVIMAAGLGVSIYSKAKGGKGGKKEIRRKSGR